MRRALGTIGAMAVLGALGAAGAAPAGADVVWLCKPGTQPDPCRESLATTVFSSDGTSRVESPAIAPNPPVDCFYVYPTVSDQPGPNATKDREPEPTAIARYQAARYSQVCRVFAPVYRQQTIPALAAGGSPAALQTAYGDVREAWAEYLASDNRGRPFVLVGHSQGTRMLRQLLRREIEPRPEVRRRLVSAVLLGGNVLVPRGRRVGGDFQSTPACAAPSETGCVIAFSTFNDTPPANSRFGRPPAADDGFGFPAGPEYEVVCTNPGSLAANARVPLTSYLRSEPFPGIIGLLLVQMYGGPPPSAPTPWLQPADRYTGRCEARAGANVLMVEPIGSARKLTPAPDATWGLHLADANIGMGELVDVVGRQIRAFVTAAATSRARPRLALGLHFSGARDVRGRRCMRWPLAAFVVGPDRGAVRRVDFAVGTRFLIRDTRAPFRALVARSRLSPGIRVIRATALLRDGRIARRTRTVRVCA